MQTIYSLSYTSYGRPSPNPYPVTIPWPFPGIHVLILKRGTQLQLIRTKIQISVPDSRRIRMLNQSAPYQRLNYVIIRRHGPLATRRRAIDLLADISLQRLDLVNRILLASRHIQDPLIVGREARLLGACLADQEKQPRPALLGR